VIAPYTALAIVTACSGRGIDRERASAWFDEVTVDTAPGLSGLAVDATGGLWTVAERDERAYRITLDSALRASTQTFTVKGVPDGTDLEGIAVLGGGRFALGTEGRASGVATVLLAAQDDDTLVVTGAITLPAASVGIPIANNQGAEGVCGEGATIVVSIEGAGEQDGHRWAPVVRIDAGQIVRTHRVWLTTKTGKLSGLDCRVASDGTIAVVAIERHFEVAKILTFTLPAHGSAEVTPTELLDLGPVLNSKLNLEGIAWTPDGRIVAVVDNQWKTITGPSELLVFRPDVVRLAR